MERAIMLKNTETGQALTLPVTPPEYPMAAGREVETLDMARTGKIALPGLKDLFDGTLEFMLPAREYPFLTAGGVADPQYYLDLLTAWSEAAQVCRYIVAGTQVNLPVLLGQLSWREQDGSNDVYCALPLREYRYLEEVRTEALTQNSGRAAESAGQAAAARQYVVVKGDTLWAICRRFYGDGSLYGKLAAANGIKNPNLIYPGQVLTIPPLEELAGLAAVSATASGSTQSVSEKSTAWRWDGASAMRSARASAREALGLGARSERTLATAAQMVALQ